MGHLARQCYNNQHPCPHEERRCEVKSSLSVRAPVITGMGEWNGWSAVRHLEVSYDGGVVRRTRGVVQWNEGITKTERGPLAAVPQGNPCSAARRGPGDHALTSGGGRFFAVDTAVSPPGAGVGTPVSAPRSIAARSALFFSRSGKILLNLGMGGAILKKNWVFKRNHLRQKKQGGVLQRRGYS